MQRNHEPPLPGRRRRYRLAIALLLAAAGLGPVARPARAQSTPSTAQSDPAPEETAGSSREALIVFADAANFQNAGEYALAAEEWNRFLQRFPDDPKAHDARFYLAVCHIQQKEYPQAIGLLEKVLAGTDRSYPRRQEALLNLATAQYSRGTANDTKLLAAAADSFGRLATEFPEGAYRDQALFFRGEALYLQDRLEEAVKAYQSLVKDHPRSKLLADALYALGTTYERLGRSDEAAGAYGRFLEGFGEHRLAAEVEMRLAETRLQKGEWEAAAAGFARAANRPGFASADHALFRQAYCLAQLERFDEAGKLFRELPKRFADSDYREPALMAAGRAFYRAGDFGQAEEVFRDIPADHADAPEALHWRARMRLDQDQPQAAWELVQSVVRSGGPPGEPASDYWAEIYRDGADALYAQPDRRDQAVALYRRVVELFPKHAAAPQALYSAAYGSLEIDKFDQAVALASQFVRQFPDHRLVRDARQVLAEALSRTGKYQESVQQYTQVLQGAPTTHPLVPYAVYGRGWAQLQLKQIEPAIGDLEYLLQHFADHPLIDQVRYALATALQQSGRLEPAVEQLSQLLRGSDLAASLRCDALYLRALCHVELDQYDLAAEDLKTIRNDYPNFRHMDRVLYELAWASKNAGNEELAGRYFSALVDESPQSPLAAEAYFHRAEHLYAQGQYAEAADAYQRTLDRPNSDPALQEKAQYKLAWSHFQQEDLEAARQAFEQLVGRWPQGEQAGEGHFMAGECLWRQEKFQPALEAFERARAAAAPVSNPQLQALLLLHGGQAAGQLGQWEKSLEWIGQLIAQQPSGPLLVEATFERGRAYQNLGRLDEALEDFQRAAEQRRSELGARARFMAGEVLFLKKDYGQAVQEFQRVMLGYGGKEAAEPIRPWQAKAGMEAARCCELLASTQRGTPEGHRWLEQAVKFFQYVATEHPQSREAETARNQLQKYGA